MNTFSNSMALALIAGSCVLLTSIGGCQTHSKIDPITSKSSLNSPPITFAPNKIQENVNADLINRIVQDEYEIRYQNEMKAFQSPNRRHAIRTTYFADGFSISPRKVEMDNWKCELKLSMIERDDHTLRPNASAKLSILRDSLMVDHGAFRQEYLNDSNGMRQNYVITERLPGEGSLKLRISCSGDLIPTSEGDSAIMFALRKNPSREVLRFSELNIWDATGHILEGKLYAAGTDVEISVNDARAIYPITIDPIATNADLRIDHDFALSEFGTCVSTAGDVNGDGYSDVIVGAPKYDGGFVDEGRAYVYLGSATGVKTIPNFIAEGRQVNAYMGHSVSTAGDVNGDEISDIIVGAYGYTHAGGPAAHGSVFVWHGYAGLGVRALDIMAEPTITTGTPANPRWQADGGQSTAEFGYSVACAGDINGDGASDIIVGAPNAEWQTSQPVRAGRVYVWYGTPDPSMTLNKVNGVCVNGTDANALFTAGGNGGFSGPNLRVGHSVASAGDFNTDGFSDIVIGSPNYRWAAVGQNTGLMSIFYGSQNGINNELATGIQVWMNVDKTTTGSNPPPMKPERQWYGPKVNCEFGFSVACAGDMDGNGRSEVIVGAPGYDSTFTNGTVQIGATFAFTYWLTYPCPGLRQFGDAVPGTGPTKFGYSVASAGDINGDGYSDVIVGDPLLNGAQPHGGFKIFVGSSNVTNQFAGRISPHEVRMDPGIGYDFGSSVACAGDVNGDGYSDVIIGAPKFARTQYPICGAAYIYHGLPEPILGNDPLSFMSYSENPHTLGSAYASAGDINGDGYEDLIVGDPGFDFNNNNDEGKIYVFRGSTSGVQFSNPWVFIGTQQGEKLGFSVANAGDVNGDGYSDVIVGAPGYDGTYQDEGRLLVFFGSSTGLSLSPSKRWEALGKQAGAQLGFSVSTAGDFNGDGFSDIIAGVPYFDYTFLVDCGAFAVWFGSSAGLNVHNGQSETGYLESANCNWLSGFHQTGSNVGYSVGTAGDFDGDGYSDILIGQPGFDYDYSTPQGPQALLDAGRVMLYYGTSGNSTLKYLIGPINTPTSQSRDGYYYNLQLGRSVSTAGDVNGDGDADVVIGAANYTSSSASGGSVFIYNGWRAIADLSPNLVIGNNISGSKFGSSVSNAGDVDGDGYSDVMVGAPDYIQVTGEDGIVYVFRGTRTGIETTPTWSYVDSYGGDCGAFVSNAGDINGDTYSDVVVGCGTQNSQGKIHVFYGGGNPRKPVVRQYRSTSTDPDMWNRLVMSGNNSGNANGFGVGATAYPPLGRGKVKLYCEVKKEGQAFSAPANSNMGNYTDPSGLIASSSWTNVGVVPQDEYEYIGPELRAFINTHDNPSLSNAKLYKWRIRARYHPATMLNGQPYSRWYYPGIGDKAERNVRAGTALGKIAIDGDPQITTRSLITSESVLVYPNPAKGSLNVELTIGNIDDHVKISIVNVLGHTVNIAKPSNLTIGRNVYQLQTNALINGTYYVMVQVGNLTTTRVVSIMK